VTFPASTVLLMEESERSAVGRGLNDGCFVPYYANDLPATRHFGGGNFVLADTHAKWFSEQDFRFYNLNGMAVSGRGLTRTVRVRISPT
jgi:hypothetical protein